jgi:hypothetical protein
MSTPIHSEERVAGLPELVHTPEVDLSESPGPPHLGATSVSLEGRSRKLRPSTFSQFDSNDIGRWIFRQRRFGLCPIHTTCCVKRGRAP